MDDKEFWRNERVAFLALASVKGVGFWSLHKIAQSDFGFKDALREPEKSGIKKYLVEARYSGGGGQEALWSEGIATARSLTSAGIRLLFKDEPDFPQKLREIPDAPEWIFIQGPLKNLKSPAVAIVGTRKPSDDGLFLTKYALAVLAKIGCVTVSGLAFGIDQTAHVASIKYAIPTVAVLGTGILQNYPKGSEALRDEILNAGGTIITEYIPQQSYTAETFVRRNRLQAALCDILIPVEWSVKSGTAHTVKYAAKYKKAIANIALPLSREKRSEIDFSATEYGASCFEVPTETDGLVHFIKSKLFGWRDAEADELSTNNDSNERAVGDSSSEKDGSNEAGQLPLI